MKKIHFFIDKMGIRDVTSNDDNYILLMYYLSERRDSDTIQRIIDELKIVQSGKKTFEEVFEEKYGTISIGVNAGEFECDKDTAFFISNHPDIEPSFEMPLQELIDLLTEWKAFMS